MSKYRFYGGVPPHEQVDTSLWAAHRQLLTANSVRARLYRWGRERGVKGWTDDEAEMASGKVHQTISARRRELVLDGLAKFSGQYRNTRTGSPARVWVAVIRTEDGE